MALAGTLLCGLAWPVLASSSADDRYRLTGELTPVAVSADQRYSLQTNAKRVQTETSADGRFTLHQLNVPEGGCASLPDLLLADHFE